MNYNIYINSKKISPNHNAAIKEYCKRLSAYCNVSVNTITTLPSSEKINKFRHCIILLENGASSKDSIEFSKYLENKQLRGISTIHILIGFTNNIIHETYPNLTTNKISITKSGLCVDTLSVLFLEQLYRSYTIINKKTYHK